MKTEIISFEAPELKLVEASKAQQIRDTFEPMALKKEYLKEIENHDLILEMKRVADLQLEREKELSLYVDDAHERVLGALDQDVFDAMVFMKKAQHEDKIRAEKKAEADRKKAAHEADLKQQKIAAENARLRREADAAEKKREKEIAAIHRKEALAHKKREAERKKSEEAHEKKRKAQEAALAEAEKKAEAEKERVAELEAQAADHQRQADEERWAEEARIEADRQAELNKDDAQKLIDLKSDLTELAEKYEFKSKKNQKTHFIIISHLEAAIMHLS